MRVWDVMKSPVVTVDEGTPLRQAMALMGGRGIRRLPVVRRGALVGILTDRDCRRAWASSAPTLAAHELTSLLDEVPVSEVMTREVITLSPETSLREAVRLIHERKIGGVPVMKGQEVVGILTTTDLLTALVGLLEERSAMTIRQIVAPTDFSELSARAVEYARGLAWECGASLTLLHVLSPPRQVEEGLSEGMLGQIRRAREREALARLREDFPDGDGTRYRVVTGHPEVEIPSVARAEGADLLVMATRRRTGLDRLLAGSVIEHVLRDAPCPVLALRG